jgi:DNA-binding LytR/AlgR family response regulator
MIRIAVYEGNRNTEEKLAQEFSRIFNELKTSYELHIILNPEQLLPMIKKDPFQFDIFCLNLDRFEITSKAIAYLREFNQLADILLINGTVEAFRKVMRYKPSDWLTTEEILDGKLLPAMKYCCTILQKSKNQCFYIKTKTRIIKIPYMNINYFESIQRQVILHGPDENNTYAFLAKLDDVDVSLPKNIFCRCHKSLIINLHNVKILDKSTKQFILNSGEDVDISKGHYKEVVDAYESFMMRN